MSEIRSICVFCGSANGNDPAFAEAARALGRALAAAGIRLVYGGGSIGLMGTVAREVLAAGGTVLGVIPQFLVDREVMLPEVTELIVTQDMHQRKRIMFEQADAFVALPGGIGTLEEVVEQMTWVQLGQHAKPIVLVDIAGFWAPLAGLLQHMTATGFIRPGFEVSYAVAASIADVLPAVRATADAARPAAAALPVGLDKL
ncbi:TIGR00730 family Rossman fold protein [Prosthecomicrobium sp. N25]|uniref:LOG family protein n=1 Tax=Prosthecomicrobium sp. N25 TaxID=3129254 RepID=UPI0030786ED8